MHPLVQPPSLALVPSDLGVAVGLLEFVALVR